MRAYVCFAVRLCSYRTHFQGRNTAPASCWLQPFFRPVILCSFWPGVLNYNCFCSCMIEVVLNTGYTCPWVVGSWPLWPAMGPWPVMGHDCLTGSNIYIYISIFSPDSVLTVCLWRVFWQLQHKSSSVEWLWPAFQVCFLRNLLSFVSCFFFFFHHDQHQLLSELFCEGKD